jgi:hypothetical protein
VTDEDPNELRPSLSADVLTEDDRPRQAVRDRQNPSFAGPCSMARPGLEPGTRDAFAPAPGGGCRDDGATAGGSGARVCVRRARGRRGRRCSRRAPPDRHGLSPRRAARTKPVQLWRHGDTRILVNHDGGGTPGPRVAAIAVESARRRALDPERGVPHPLGGAQRPAPRDRRQELPPLRRRRPQPHLHIELSADPGLAITVWTAEPGSKSGEALSLLGNWAATVEQANLAHASGSA